MYKTIKKTVEFKSVHSLNYGYSSRYMRVKIKKNIQKTTRVGYSISKRKGTAVSRNLVKRRLKNIICDFKLEPGWDIVVVAKVGIKNTSYDELMEDLKKICSKLELLQ